MFYTILGKLYTFNFGWFIYLYLCVLDIKMCLYVISFWINGHVHVLCKLFSSRYLCFLPVEAGFVTNMYFIKVYVVLSICVKLFSMYITFDNLRSQPKCISYLYLYWLAFSFPAVHFYDQKDDDKRLNNHLGLNEAKNFVQRFFVILVKVNCSCTHCAKFDSILSVYETE